MAESTLSVSFKELKATVGHYLGHGGTEEWTPEQDAEIERYVQAGVRQFYYPPAVEGIEAGYNWSFLEPKTTLTTTADVGTDTLPDTLARIIGPMFHEPDIYAQPITIISRQQIRRLKSGSDDTGTPQYAAVRAKTSDGSTGQRNEIEWWPIPDDAYTITYLYEAYQGKLDDDYPYPLGGMKHSELVVTSCLAIAELRANDERGIHWEAFIRQLASAIRQDRKHGAQYFGPMAGPDKSHIPSARTLRSGDVTYNGDTW